MIDINQEYNNNPNPQIKISKNSVPIIYLDTCAMIEFAKIKKGTCTNEHASELRTVYETMVSLIEDNLILCPLGNQLEEMGVARDRESAREFLFYFTNGEMYLPFEIEKEQMTLGYQSFLKNGNCIELNADGLLETPTYCWDSRLEIKVSPIYSDEKIKEIRTKQSDLAMALNDMKENGISDKNFEIQLQKEFEGDFQTLEHVLKHCSDSDLDKRRFFNMISDIFAKIGINCLFNDVEEFYEFIKKYCKFLMSSYHHKLPFNFINAVIYAYRMTRSKKISPSDKLDTLWAASYIPFVDYAVTDSDFCNLLNDSGLAELYGTKVYSFKTLDMLLKDLSTLKS